MCDFPRRAVCDERAQFNEPFIAPESGGDHLAGGENRNVWRQVRSSENGRKNIASAKGAPFFAWRVNQHEIYVGGPDRTVAFTRTTQTAPEQPERPALGE